MKNLRLTMLYLLAGYVLPLALRPERLFHYKTALLMVACVVMLSWANPEISRREEQQHRRSDKGTMILIFLMGYVALVTPIIEWGYFMNDTGLTVYTIAGICVVAAGLAFRIYAIKVLGQQFTGAVQQVSTHQLVTQGPYRLIRHPSYLGSVATFAGCAILLEAWAGLVISIAAMMTAYCLRIQAEEDLLTAVFGKQYLEYRRKSWRMLPFIW